MTGRIYASPQAFKQALEQRLRATTNGVAFSRKRQILVFERFLARVADAFGEAVVLKGGLVLELRLDRVRTTKDVDLRMVGSPEDVLDRLRLAARRDMDDFMTFEIGPDADHPEIQNDGMKYDGQRFRAECKIAGKQYGYPFGVDVAFGDPILGEPELIVAEDLLGFAGIVPPSLRIYPIETHVAEKLHAYTIPRRNPNSRVKDFPDLALLASVRPLDANRLRDALEQTFSFRGTHPLPLSVPDPPDSWKPPYAAMAREDQLPWPTLDDATQTVRAFLDPILSRSLDAVWNPETWEWNPR